MTNLDKKVEEYYKLKVVRDGLDERLKELSNQIKKSLSEGEHSFGKYIVEIQVRDRTSLDEFVAEDVLIRLGLWPNASKVVVDPDAVESLYLQGLISDTDLREMREAKYSTALIIREVETQDV